MPSRTAKKIKEDFGIEEEEPQLMEVPEVNDAKPKKKRELSEEQKQHLENIRKIAAEKKKLAAEFDPNSVKNRRLQKQKDLEELRKKKQQLEQEQHEEQEEEAEEEPEPEPEEKPKRQPVKKTKEDDVVVKNAAYYRNKYKTLKKEHQDLTYKTIESLQKKQEKTRSYADDLIKIELQREQRTAMAKLMGININE
eukprot:765645-Hanusia_phi.AAC.4